MRSWLSALRRPSSRGPPRLVNGTPSESIAIVNTTSECIANLAMGLDWRPGA